MAIRDLTADSYRGGKAVTNIQAGGGLYAQRIVTRRHYDLEAAKDRALQVAGLATANTEHDRSPCRRSPAVPPLAGLRALECGDTVASAYAGGSWSISAPTLSWWRIAPAIRYGPPARTSGRARGATAAPASAYFAAGKRSICVDVGTRRWALLAHHLAGTPTCSSARRATGRDWITDDVARRSEAADPGLIVADVSTFGRLAGGDRHPHERPAGAGGRRAAVGQCHRAVRPDGDTAALPR